MIQQPKKLPEPPTPHINTSQSDFSPSNIKKLILSSISNNELKKIVQELDIKNVDLRINDPMRTRLLRSRKTNVQNLLEFSKEWQVKSALDQLGIPSKGRKKRLIKKLLKLIKDKQLAKVTLDHPQKSGNFVALDFETANRYRDSACSVALVKVKSWRIIQTEYLLIRPPKRFFEFANIHGIKWHMVAQAPSFRQIWPSLEDLFDGADFLAAHNAPFDRSVLKACCEASNIQPPKIPFLCTVRLARKKWGIYPTRLPNVCEFLKIHLQHHNALSDAVACAKIVIAASKYRKR